MDAHPPPADAQPQLHRTGQQRDRASGDVREQPPASRPVPGQRLGIQPQIRERHIDEEPDRQERGNQNRGQTGVARNRLRLGDRGRATDIHERHLLAARRVRNELAARPRPGWRQPVVKSFGRRGDRLGIVRGTGESAGYRPSGDATSRPRVAPRGARARSARRARPSGEPTARRSRRASRARTRHSAGRPPGSPRRECARYAAR